MDKILIYRHFSEKMSTLILGSKYLATSDPTGIGGYMIKVNGTPLYFTGYEVYKYFISVEEWREEQLNKLGI